MPHYPRYPARQAPAPHYLLRATILRHTIPRDAILRDTILRDTILRDAAVAMPPRAAM